MEPTSLAQNHMTQKNLPPSQTASEVWGKIMGNNPWTRTGACHTYRWKTKTNKDRASRGGGWEIPKKILSVSTLTPSNDEWTKFTRRLNMISAYGNRRKTQGTQFRAQDLSWDIIVLYRHINLERSIGTGNRHTVHWHITLKSVLGFCPGILAS